MSKIITPAQFNPLAPKKVRITLDVNLETGEMSYRSDLPLNAVFVIRLMCQMADKLAEQMIQLDTMTVGKNNQPAEVTENDKKESDND